MTASQYFTKIKSLCDEIQKVDAEVQLVRLECVELLLEAGTPGIVALS